MEASLAPRASLTFLCTSKICRRVSINARSRRSNSPGNSASETGWFGTHSLAFPRTKTGPWQTPPETGIPRNTRSPFFGSSGMDNQYLRASHLESKSWHQGQNQVKKGHALTGFLGMPRHSGLREIYEVDSIDA